MDERSTRDPTGVYNMEIVTETTATDAGQEERLGDDRDNADEETNGPRATEEVAIEGQRMKDDQGRRVDGEDTRDFTLLGPERKKGGRGKRKAVSFIQLFKYGDKLNKIFLLVGMIGAIGNGASQPILSLLFGNLIDAFGNNLNDTNKLVDAVSAIALDFLGLAIGSAISSYLEVTCFMIAAERQAGRIRTLYLRAVLRQDIAFFDTDTSTGEVIIAMSGDIVLIQDATGEKAGKVFRVIVTFLGGYVVAFVRSWRLTFVIMSAIPIMLGIGITSGILISRVSNRAQAAYAGAGSVVEQITGSIRTVASFTGEVKAVEDYDKQLQIAERANIMIGLISGYWLGTVLGVMFGAYGLALWYGSQLVLHDGLKGGQVITVIFAVLTGAMSLGQASPCFSVIAIGRSAAYKIYETIERTPSIDVYDMSGLVPDKIKGDIELQNVDFHYPTRPDVTVFSNFSLTIPSGHTVALVGQSGSGKSTVVSLIERFYDPLSGAVLIDGMDIRSIQLKWLRQQIGLVSQEPVLFNASVKENIAYGNQNATMEEIELAARVANAAQFITKASMGYDTIVGERGIQLSGGQKQRIAIARAILKNPRILLLDEATSALDATSERVVQNALDKITTHRTTVVVAHRLTTIRNADMIGVIERGVVVETGTHDELIQKQDGAYSQLVRLQDEDKENDQTNDESVIHPDYVPEPEDTPKLKRDSVHSSRRSSRYLAALSAYSLFGSQRMSQDGGMRAEQSGVPVKNAGIGDDMEKGQEEEECGGTKKPLDVSIIRLAKLNRPELPLFLLGSVAAACSGLLFPMFGWLLSNVIYSFFKPPEEMKKDISFWAEMFIVLGIGVFFSIPGRSVSFSIVGERLIRRVRKLTFENILRQEIAWFDGNDNSSGAICSRLSSDAAAVRGVVGDALALLVTNLSTVVAGSVIALNANWKLALIVLAVVPLLSLQTYVHSAWLQGLSEGVKSKYEDASRLAADAVSSIRTVASFVAEDRICSLYEEGCKRPLKNGLHQSIIAGLAIGFSNLFTFIAYSFCFWTGARLVRSGSLTFKELFMVFFAISMSANAITQSVSTSSDFAKAKIAVNSIFEMLDRKSSIDPGDMSGKIIKDPKGHIEFRSVSFFYPTRPDVQIFHGLSFQLQAGKTLGLVGESGCGKSTVVSLIERFYQPQSGVIFVDGVNIQNLQLKWLRQQIGLVNQEPVLFDETVDWNIVYGKEGTVTEGEIQAAAEASNAHKFISALPEGYKTRVGERGTQLSGGQKQRIAIARSLIKDPKILLLDEATSALDAESERVVQEALDRIMVNRTTIVIAHRLTTVRNADIIAVVRDGGIVEQGIHSELLAKDGAYAALVKLQAM